MSKKYTMPQFAAALRKMGDDVRRQTLEKAALEGAAVIEGAAKVNVKANFNNRTGNLASSINVKVIQSDADKVVVAVGPSDVIYGRIQELGGVIKPVSAKRLHWVDENGKHHVANAVTLPARPYLRPAVDDNKAQIIDAVSATLRREIEGSI
jgi:HK97 gp10 family phage protein